MIDWTEKYRPKSLQQVVGNQAQIRKLESWANMWRNGQTKKKAAVLSGKPGIGKTSAAYALAHDFGWLPIELNASDARNATTIKAIATAGATHQTFSDTGEFISTKSGGRKLIIIDEADNLFERSKDSAFDGTDLGDRDGKKTIVETVKLTQQPIVLIVNDEYQLFKGSGSTLRKDCFHLKMYPANPPEILRLLKKICIKEDVQVERKVLFSIAESSQGDIRSAVRDLQSITLNKAVVTSEATDVLGHRDRSQLIFDALQDIFHTKDDIVIRRNVQLVQEDPRMMLLWVAENLPKSYSSINDIVNSYQWLSRSDLFLGRTYRRSHYGLWSYACDLSTVGVAFSKQDRVHQVRYQFPSWLKQNSRYKNTLSTQHSVIAKLSKYHHCSLKKTRSFIFPYLRKVASNNTDFLISVVNKLELSDDEAEMLAGHNVKKILATKKKNEQNISSKKQRKENNSSKKKRKKQRKQKDNSLGQQSLGVY